MKFNNNQPLRRTAVALSIASILLPSKMFAGVILSLNDSANDAGNHRMEQAIAIGDSVFQTTSVDDTVEVQLTGRSGDEYGETIRAYLYKDVTYRASVGSYTTVNDSTTVYYGGSMDDSVLSMVADKSSTSSSSTVGLATAANGLDFNYSASDYKVVASNDDGLENASVGSAFMSQLEFTVTQTGYHYFYVSRWNGGVASTIYDSGVGYSSNGGSTAIDGNGSFLSDAGFTPTGSVVGGFQGTSAFYLMHRSGETPTPPSA